MHFYNIAVLLAAGVAHVHAAPKNATPQNLVAMGKYTQLHSRDIGNGTLSYWGDASVPADNIDYDEGWNENHDAGASSASSTDDILHTRGLAPKNDACRKFGIQHQWCKTDGEYKAKTKVCATLVDILRKNPEVKIQNIGTRTIRWMEGDDGCWVGWRGDVPGLAYKHLVPAALKHLGACGNKDGFAGGYTEDVDLNGVCTTECVAGKPICG